MIVFAYCVLYLVGAYICEEYFRIENAGKFRSKILIMSGLLWWFLAMVVGIAFTFNLISDTCYELSEFISKFILEPE